MKQVSILIPCYNSEHFISETLECCKQQTYPNLEVVLVDDGSSDKSYEIARIFASENIHVYQQSNSGACRARNLAFEKSTGEYIIYLDADDLICDTYISNLVNSIEGKEQNAIATGQWDRFCNNIEESQFPELCVYKDYMSSMDLLLEMWNSGEMLACSSYLVPRKLIEKVGGWDESILKNQDGEFFARVLLECVKIYHTEKAKFYYRTGSYNSVSKATSKAKIASMLNTFISYRKNALVKEDSRRVREALSVNFTLFMYIHGNQFSDLCEKARQEIKTLGVGYQLKVVPRRVMNICKYIGFDCFLWIRKHFLHR